MPNRVVPWMTYQSVTTMPSKPSLSRAQFGATAQAGEKGGGEPGDGLPCLGTRGADLRSIPTADCGVTLFRGLCVGLLRLTRCAGNAGSPCRECRSLAAAGDWVSYPRAAGHRVGAGVGLP